MFCPPDELHQRRWCDVLNLRFVAPVAYGPGSPSTYLTVPNRTVNVPDDGNCLFSALSYIVTGSKRQHAQMRAVIVRNMPFFENELMRNVIKVLSAKFYFHKPITVHLELYLFYHFIHFVLYIGQY